MFLVLKKYKNNGFLDIILDLDHLNVQKSEKFKKKSHFSCRLVKNWSKIMFEKQIEKFAPF